MMMMMLGRRLMSSSSRPSQKSVNFRNYATAGTLMAFTGGVYYYVIISMKEMDELTELENEGKINVHESGLKVTKPPRGMHDALHPKN